MPYEPRWAWREPFNPLSSPQMIAYLRYKNYEVPKDKDTGNATSDEEGLERLLKYHPYDPVIPKVLLARRLTKAQSYLQDSHVGLDERLHGVFGFDPSTGRLSMKDPNLMNVPQGKQDATEKLLAKYIRKTIRAEKGKVLLERDWRAVESLLVGFAAKDPVMMRWARLGMHGILGLARIGTPVDYSAPDSVIAAQSKAFKKSNKPVYDRSKITDHAFAYGETEFAISKSLEGQWFQELGPEQLEILARDYARCGTKKKCYRELPIPNFFTEAREFTRTFVGIAPGLLDWQDDARLRAHVDGILWNKFKYPYRFFDVFREKDTGKRKRRRDRKGRILGEQSNEPLAFEGGQSNGAGMLRSTLLEFAAKPGPLEMLLPIHDSILFQVDEVNLKEAEEYSKAVMERKFPELDGLWCGTEATVGKEWSNMEEVIE